MTVLMALGLVAAAQPAVPASGAQCTQLLTGRWAGRGVVSAFGPAMKVEATATYRADHGFVATTRFTGSDGRPQEQTSTGRWSATAGRRRGTCTIDMTSESAGGSSSSSSDIQFADRDTYRALGVDMRRVR